MDSGGRSYSIRDLENSCGIKAHTIRMWEKRYGILTPDRSNTNIRLYSEEELKKLITVALLNRNGLKISRIARLNDSELLREVMKLSQGNGDRLLEARQAEIIMPALRFNEEKYREALTAEVNKMGSEEAYIRLFHPLALKARTLWLTDCISKPQEQFIVQGIRTLMTSEEITLTKKPDRETVSIVNLGDNEGINNLIFLKYLLRKRGFNVVFTEGILSTSDIKSIHTILPFTILVLDIPASIPDGEVTEFSTPLVKDLHLKKVLIMGRYKKYASGADRVIEVVCSPEEMVSWADRLR